MGGFVAVPRGGFAVDPTASMVQVTGQRWSLETPTQPVLKGTKGIGFDAQFSRWIPASPEVFSSDGSQYAWTERENDGKDRLHLISLSDGSDRSFDVSPPRDPDLPAPHIPVPLAITRDGVILSYGWEGLGTVWRLDPSRGLLTKIYGRVAPISYGAGAVWFSPLRGTNPVGLGGDTLARLDLASGEVQDWFHRDALQVYPIGFDMSGNPWVQVYPSLRGDGPQIDEIWRVRAPNQADLILSGQRVWRVQGDSHGTWFGNETGVYLYAGNRVGRVSSASVEEVLGPCL